jgi:hypothetical protein
MNLLDLTRLAWRHDRGALLAGLTIFPTLLVFALLAEVLA